MRFLADILYLVAAILYAPVALYNAIVLGKNRRGWGQRLGRVPRRDPAMQRVWIHAVSLGEVNATPALVTALREAMPELDVVVSATTDTGYNRAVQLYGADRVFRFPLDFSFVIRRALNRIAPTMLVLVELEVWYNLVHQCHRRGIPVCVVNGRLTQRSARRLGWIGPFARSMFARLAWVGAQDRAIADRFIALGTPAERVEVTSSMKWDTATVADRVPGMDALRDAMGIDPAEPLWVCGSTGPDEEELILDAYEMLVGRQKATGSRQQVEGIVPRLAIIPRKPERFDEVARLIESRGFSCLRRSRCPDGGSGGMASRPVDGRPSIILGDTLGELRKFYALATVVFVGRSLVSMGGSDPIEVAALGKPILAGPHMENFLVPAAALRVAGTLATIDNSQQLSDTVVEWLKDSPSTASRGRKGQRVVVEHQGATKTTCERLIEQMNASGGDQSTFSGGGRLSRVQGALAILMLFSTIAWAAVWIMSDITFTPDIQDWHGVTIFWRRGAMGFLSIGRGNSICFDVNRGRLSLTRRRDLPREVTANEYSTTFAGIEISGKYVPRGICGNAADSLPEVEKARLTATRTFASTFAFPIPVPTVMSGMYPLLYGIRRRMIKKRGKLGHCRNCGYNLTGLSEPRCPECGAGFALQQA